MLVPTLNSGKYRITVMRKRQKTEYLIKYDDFQNSIPTWIDSK